MKFDPESMTLEFKSIEICKDAHGDEFETYPNIILSALDIAQIISFETPTPKQKSLGYRSAIVAFGRYYWLKESFEEVAAIYKYVRKEQCSYNKAVENLNKKLLERTNEIRDLMDSVNEKILGQKK